MDSGAVDNRRSCLTSKQIEIQAKSLLFPSWHCIHTTKLQQIKSYTFLLMNMDEHGYFFWGRGWGGDGEGMGRGWRGGGWGSGDTLLKLNSDVSGSIGCLLKVFFFFFVLFTCKNRGFFCSSSQM